MKNLMTRKLVIGLLMTLVLALGVHGIAEAQVTVELTSGDNQTKKAGETFTIGFKISIGATPTLNADNDGDTTNDSYDHAVSFDSDVTLTTTSNIVGGQLRITSPQANRTYSYSLSYKVDDGATAGPKAASSLDNATVYVVPDSNIGADLPVLGTGNTLGYLAESGTVQINGGATDLLTEVDPGDNEPLRYSVSGGTLYVPDGSTNGRTVSSSQIISSAAPVWLRMNGRTSVVGVYVEGQDPASRSAKLTVIYRFPRLRKISGDSPKQVGAPSSRLLNPFTVQVRDGSGATGNAVPGQVVTFVTTETGSDFSAHPDFPDPTATTTNIPAGAPQTDLATSQTANVTTDSQGNASVFLVLGTISTGTSLEHTVTARVGPAGTPASLQVSFRADAVSAAEARSITKVAGTDGQRADAFGNIEEPLTVVVRDQGGSPKQGENVTFSDRSGGTLSRPIANVDPGVFSSGDTRTQVITTDANGEASVNYTAREEGGVHTVAASITTGGYKETLFTINGTPSSGNQQQNQQNQGQQGTPGARLVASSTTVTGEAGSTQTVTIRAVDADNNAQTGVSISLNALSTFIDAGGSYSSSSGNSPFTVTLTLPSTAGTYSFSAAASGYSSATVSVTVTEPATLGRLSITRTGTPSNGIQDFIITARDSDGDPVSGDLRVSVSGSGFTTTPAIVLNGSVRVSLRLPTVARTYTLTVSADDYTSGETTVVITADGQTTDDDTADDTEDEDTTVAEPDSIRIVGTSQRSGTVNTALDRSLVVQVLDAGNDPVEDVRVIFRRASGQGRVSDGSRGGRSIAVRTDEDGYASITYTPMSTSSTVEAEARGVTRTVTFTITASGGTDTPSSARDTDTDTDTPSRDTISPNVRVGASSRPPMLWVDGGAIYALVGAKVARFAPSVDNALNLAVGGGKVYWTEKTGNSSGTINAANLDGSGVTELAVTQWSVPMGIAVDTANQHLYWTNSSGKIKRANLNGRQGQNVIPEGLDGVMDLALVGGNAYWTQGGNVRYVNLSGQKQIRNISTGTDTAGSLAIGGGKVYWTEQTSESSGTINSANLDGSGVTELVVTQWSVPMGIGIDTARSRLYWTNSSGKIKRANLDGRQGQNVVDGLGSPTELVLSNSITAPVAGGTSTGSGTTADTSKYDVNGDGSVDNADASLVAAAMNTSNAKYDVNGDGTVNFLDLLLVFDNRDDGAAAAPTIVGMQMTAAQVDILQEQIDLLIATGDRSPAAMRTLIYLQQLIATARPEQTQLLANYPNPFNPETWIPYELATDTSVRITIYNTQGVVIRTLELGHQSAGYYTGRDRAAYWDGRNAHGEQVASGIYFYQLETDGMSSMRKMVILK